ncbi:MAG TPA: hypothetical protein VIU11_16175 [Nakamurella sp.]
MSCWIDAVTCWYRAAIALFDQPMTSMTARSGTPRIRRNGRSRVSRVMQASIANAGRREQSLPLGVVGARIDWRTSWRGEQPFILVPQLGRGFTLGGLGRAMPAQQHDQLIGQPNSPAAGS